MRPNLLTVRHKNGSRQTFSGRDAAVVLSLALQHGAPIETIRHAVTRNSLGEPRSILGAVVDQINASAAVAIQNSKNGDAS